MSDAPETTTAPIPPQAQGGSALMIVRRIQALLRTGELDDKKSARRDWIRLTEPTQIKELIAIWAKEDALGELRTSFAGIGCTHGFKGKVDSLRAQIEHGVAQLEREESDRQAGAVVGQALSVWAALGDHVPPPHVASPELLKRLQVPPRYRLSPKGVAIAIQDSDGSWTTKLTIHSPVFMLARTADVNTGRARRHLCWRSIGGWRSDSHKRGTLMNSRLLIDLANDDVPVTSGNVSQVVQWLSDFEAHNAARMDAFGTTARLGWQQDGTFLLPSVHIQHPTRQAISVAFVPPEGLDDVARAYRTGGTWEGWLAAGRVAAKYPNVMAMMLTYLSSPLLELLGAKGFMVDLASPTSGGKTTALRFAGSLAGYSDENSSDSLLGSCGVNLPNLESRAYMFRNLCVLLDEGKLTESRPGHMSAIIFLMTKGRGFDKGAKKVGTTRKTLTWRVTCGMSGEGAATNQSKDAGTRARVLTLRGPPFGQDPIVGSADSEAVSMIIDQHYGHAIVKFIQYLVTKNTEEGREELRSVHAEYLNYYKSLMQTKVGKRHAANLAVLHLTMDIASHVGIPLPETEAGELNPVMVALLNAADRAGREADIYLAAFQELMSWVYANSGSFWGRHEVHSNGRVRWPSQGFYGSWQKDASWVRLGVRRKMVQDLLRSTGFKVPGEIIDEWKRRGWLTKDDPRMALGPSHKGAVYGIERTAVDDLERSLKPTWGTTIEESG